MQVTRSKIVWLSLAMALESRPDIARADEPLSNYTAEELEEWVLRRSWIHRSLESASCMISLRQSSVVKLGFQSKLIPGGRWLLSGGKLSAEKGFVMRYVDLDSEVLESTVLFTVGKIEGGYDLSLYDFWVVPDAPALTVRVFMWDMSFVEPSSRKPSDGLTSVSLTFHKAHNGRTRVVIYTVSLTGHGSAARLTAEPFRSFQGSFPGCCWHVDFDETRFIHLKSLQTGASYYMHVLHYAQPASDSVQPITVQLTATDTIVRLSLFSICWLTQTLR